MAVLFSVKAETAKLRNELREARRRLEDQRPAWEEAGELMLRSVHKNFEEGGRPEKWAPLSSETLIQRAGGKRRAYTKRGDRLRVKAQRTIAGAKPLGATHRLEKSISYEAHPAGLDLETTLIYAATHQYGRDEIDARPFLIAQPEDERQIAELLERYLAGAFK